jgi:hypothetical protein
MKCMYIDVEKSSFEDGLHWCPFPATHRHGRRLYCEAHAPADAVKLDKFANASAMTVADKAAEYDRVSEYLREQGWEVLRESKMPDSGRVVQWWDHPGNQDHGTPDWMSAYRVECYKDAPGQGERLSATLREFEETIDKKAAESGVGDVETSTEKVMGVEESSDFLGSFLTDCMNGFFMRMSAKLGARMAKVRDTRPCPKCGAAIGEWCKVEEGEHTGKATIHKERRE